MSAIADDRMLDLDACNDVVIALNDIRSEWQTLGTFLKISNPTITSISTSHGDDHFRKLSSLISCWLRREKHNDHPSWRNLCIALENMGHVTLAVNIARKHKVTSGGPASSSNYVDRFKEKLLPDVSASDILRVCSANMISGITADPIKFGNDLSSMGLVSPHEVDGLVNIHGVTAYEKATRLVGSLSRSLKARNDPIKLLQICQVLEQQDVDTLNDLVGEILTKIVAAPTVTTTCTTSQALPTAPNSQPNTEAKEVDIEKIKKVFDRKMDKLQEVISPDILQRAADEMIKADIIGKDDKNPPFESIVKQFIDGLEFEEDHDKVGKQCELFLSLLFASGQGVGGPFKKCIEWLRNEFIKLGYSISSIVS